MSKDIILIGGGGHCRSVIDVAESAGYQIIGILDKPELAGSQVLGYPIIGTDEDISQYAGKASFHITVGQITNAAIREQLYKKVVLAGGFIATIISPFAVVSKHAHIGQGCTIMHKAVVNANATIGQNCIINTSADIEHDVSISDFCHISTGATINGAAKVGHHSFIGSNATVNQGVTITNHVILGSGSVLTKDVLKPGIYTGAPATLKIKIEA